MDCVPLLLRKFFQHYHNFDWNNIICLGDHGNEIKPSPMKIVTHLTPHQNTASNVFANGRKVIVEQVRRANKRIEAGEWGCVFEEISFCDEYDIFLAIIFGCQSREFSKFLVRHHLKINEILQNDNIDFNHLDCECHPFLPEKMKKKRENCLFFKIRV